jgi:hypothetical protein
MGLRVTGAIFRLAQTARARWVLLLTV